MKVLIKPIKELTLAGRWDIDFHLPASEITKYPKNILRRIGDLASFPEDTRDPGQSPDKLFQYIDISCVDVETGLIRNTQELAGEDAPSRARKVVRAFDIVVSTVRPTRGATAIVPLSLHNQIASTGFSVLRPNADVNPFYLHYVLRLPSTLEQFRKWSTGSSYPAILDEDVEKTLVPVPDVAQQDAIASKIMEALRRRDVAILKANHEWEGTLKEISNSLQEVKTQQEDVPIQEMPDEEGLASFSVNEINEILARLPKLPETPSK